MAVRGKRPLITRAFGLSDAVDLETNVVVADVAIVSGADRVVPRPHAGSIKVRQGVSNNPGYPTRARSAGGSVIGAF